MATNLTFSTAQTNQTPKSCTSQTCNCKTFWSLLQQTAYVKLSNSMKQNQYHLEPWYEQRARRIAAIYARIYLEMDKELGGKPLLKGRFYWMGLGAFASKTVAAIFGSQLTALGNKLDDLPIIDRYLGEAPKSIHIFAKGNLWLFMDVAPWHWAWALSPDTFSECKSTRNNALVEPVERALKALPWASTVLPTIERFKLTEEIDKAFALLKDIEQLKPFSKDALKKQLEHLKLIAIQEQKNILQKICWNHPWMKEGAKIQRSTGTPKTFIRFHSSYDEELPPPRPITTSSAHSRRPSLLTELEKIERQRQSDKFKFKLIEDPYSYAPANMSAEKYDSRMVWIFAVAAKYHRLMSTGHGRYYIERHLYTIATWVNSTKKGKPDIDTNDPNGNQ